MRYSFFALMQEVDAPTKEHLEKLGKDLYLLEERVNSARANGGLRSTNCYDDFSRIRGENVQLAAYLSRMRMYPPEEESIKQILTNLNLIFIHDLGL